MSDLYQETILEELRNPQNYGELENADFVIEETNASCGDEIKLYLKIDKNTKKINSVSWTGKGCAISQASTSFLTQHILGKSLQDLAEISQKDIEDLLGITEISVGRVKCLMLGAQALKKI